MRSWMFKIGNLLASLALVMTVFNFNVCCSFMAYQPEMPEGFDDLCKF